MKTVLKTIPPILLIFLAYWGAKQLIASKKPPQSKPVPTVIPEVETHTLSPADHYPPVLSYGNVQSYFETSLTAEVSGSITFVAPTFRVGEFVTKDTVLVKLDSTNYQSTLAKVEADLAEAKKTLAEEVIRAQQAAEDWTASGRKLESASDFVLRKPQLVAAQANIKSLESSIGKARTDIDRTILRAPFDAVISLRNASLGNYASAQSNLGTLVATERAEIRLPFTAEQRARLPQPLESPIRITLTSPTQLSSSWHAQLVRSEPVIDPQNQVSYLIAEIESPYTNQTAALPVGTFVKASIPALAIKNSLKVSEASLVNDQFLWLVDSQNILHKQMVERRYSHLGFAYVTPTEANLDPPFQVISRPLTNFRSGMKVKNISQ